MSSNTPADKAKGGTVQGEGDYEAGRRFDKAEQDFVKSGKAGERSGQAAPHDAAEASELEDAESEGRSHSKGEAPGDLDTKKNRPQR
ncbi:hypothetical protein [Piscinibacter terrae]|uniref:Uncharacterized protein n=1 Tax=Piscinibacter terrae TaxID=2496871 RepID=A0A3N7JVB3_9BURK|nr:hypothetical protein [Albitalea terrae]RQP22845.1 hypothetical protein DZC73_21395 [Albitalea terrae]